MEGLGVILDENVLKLIKNESEGSDDERSDVEVGDGGEGEEDDDDDEESDEYHDAEE